MSSPNLVRIACLATALCCALLSPAGAPRAASFPEFVDPNPSPGNGFGNQVVPLPSGNVVITSPFDDAGGFNAGAVYLFNGSTGALISTLRGSSAGDEVGLSARALSNGNYVVQSTFWDNGAFTDAGAVTWGSGATGVSGTVSAANSLVGASADDRIGSIGSVTVLTNGNYVVVSPTWNNGVTVDAGAVTWGNGTTGITGAVSPTNSLVGSTTSDQVGSAGVTALTNGNYVVASPLWNNGATGDAGAATWGNGATGITGAVNATNSLVGSAASDQVGSTGVTALTNGNYVIGSPLWNNGAIADAGAATWGSGATGVTGVIVPANSLVGSAASDQVGSSGVTALTNGNYVVASSLWNNGAIADAGAATWGSGTIGVTGAVSAANSLVGSTAADQVGSGGAIALTNGSYVVVTQNWHNGAIANAGAATWASGTTGVSGAVSPANSLVGSAASDFVGGGRVTALTNGSYVVSSPTWNSGGIADAGAATWGSGTTGVSGVITAANSLIGSKANDRVGGFYGVTALTNGNYVVPSPQWGSGSSPQVGAATWGSGTTGVVGVVSTINSLVGSTASDQVATTGVIPLTNGNYVVASQYWDSGFSFDAGAATWGSGTTGVVGVVSAANSLVGSAGDDEVGAGGVKALANGNYVVQSPMWDNGSATDAGAATWGSGTTGVTGAVSAANSLVGSTASDQVPSSGGVTALSNGNYAVLSYSWDNGALANAGSATWGSGVTGVRGVITAANSLVGAAANTNLVSTATEDALNATFLCRFLNEGGGRVRVGPFDNAPVLLSATDIPGDQGGWLRLSFSRSFLDNTGSTLLISTYGIWRHVPGTAASRAIETTARAAHDSRGEPVDTAKLRVALPAECDAWESGGRLFVTVSDSRPGGIAASFPPGTWELVSTVPAVQLPQYLAAVPTISNAAPNDFVVTAHTTNPAIWLISNTISGQSVDNLAPAPPTNFAAGYADGATHLQWAANSEPDLGSYSLYRGSSAGFTPSIANQIASQIATSFNDVGPAGSYYKLSALDVNGNESGFVLVTPGQTTAVDGGEPVTFALEGALPNPARGHDLFVAFALPSGAAARLELVDLSGRLILTREVGSLGPGRHLVNLAERRGVASGIYWVRLIQGASRRTTRAAVIE